MRTSVAQAWALTSAVGLVYAVWVAGFPIDGDRIESYVWIVVAAAAPSFSAVLTLVHRRIFVLALLAASATGLGVAYGLALLTYGSGTEDGTVWRGIGGAVLGAVSGLAGWVVVRLR